MRTLLFLLALLLLVGTTALTGEKKVYQQVPNWWKLPPDLKLGPVSGVGVDSRDNVFVLQRSQPHVLVFDKDGNFLKSWTGIFKTPHGLRIDAQDHVWIADMANHLVQKFTPEGKLLLTLGTKDKTGQDDKHFNKPADAFVGPQGEIYVADGYGNGRVAKFSPDGKFLKEWGQKGKKDAEFNIVHGVFLDGTDRVLVADRENKRVQIFSTEGQFQEKWTDTGHPYGLFIHKDRVFLADGRAGLIRVLDRQGKLLDRWETGKDNPHWITVDSQGAVYVGFVYSKQLQKWTPR